MNTKNTRLSRSGTAHDASGVSVLRFVGRGAILLSLLLSGPACSPGGRHFDFMPARAPATASGAPAAPSAWLDYLNFYRATARLKPVTENTAWSAGGRKHAIYMVKKGAAQHGEDPGNAYYTPEGHTAAQQSNLFFSANTTDTDWWAIDTWMQSPFHALGVLDPQLVQVGYGSHREAPGPSRAAAALNVLAGRRPTVKATYPVFWPGDGTTVPMNLHWGGQPSPLAGCRGYRLPSGLPVILQIGPGKLTPAVSATSFTQNGQPLEHCVFDETNYRNPDWKQQNLGRGILAVRDAIVLVPRSPLTAGATYKVSITANSRTYTWSFSVSGAARAPGSLFLAGAGMQAPGRQSPTIP